MSGEGALHRFAHEAMTTVFEVVIAEASAQYARQAALALFKEIDRLEGLLSRFDAGSDICQINRLQPGQSVRVSEEVYDCLRTAAGVYAGTGGAFDPTVGALVDARRDSIGEPAQSETAEKERPSGERLIDRLELCEVREEGLESLPRAFVVGLREAQGSAPFGGVSLDLGGIGKGFALDRLAPLLEDWGVEAALIHGGTSTALAVGSGGEAAGCPPGARGWPLGVGGEWGKAAGVERVFLENAALSGSGLEVKGSHIVDPRAGGAARGHRNAWVVAPSAALADALSTAFIVMSTAEVEAYCAGHPDVAVLVVRESAGAPVVRRFGRWA